LSRPKPTRVVVPTEEEEVVRKEILVLRKDGKISWIGRVKMKMYYVELTGKKKNVHHAGNRTKEG
jgi:hypothetical protein